MGADGIPEYVVGTANNGWEALKNMVVYCLFYFKLNNNENKNIYIICSIWIHSVKMNNEQHPHNRHYFHIMIVQCSDL